MPPNGCLLIKINWKKSGKGVIGIFDFRIYWHFIVVAFCQIPFGRCVICARRGIWQLKAHFIPLLMTKFCHHVHARRVRELGKVLAIYFAKKKRSKWLSSFFSSFSIFSSRPVFPLKAHDMTTWCQSLLVSPDNVRS